MQNLNLTTHCYNLLDLTESEKAQVYQAAGEILHKGGTVVFPTETVYGLGADAMNPEAVSAIYKAKGRPSDNPLIIHVADFDISKIVREIPSSAVRLMETYWPGPLTIIMKKNPGVPDATTGSLDTVGVRMPDQPAALEMIKAGGGFIAAPSANISGRPSPTTFQRCVEDLYGRVDMILGMDQSKVGLESTIIDVSGETPELLRPGAITLEMLQETLGTVIYEPGNSLSDDVAPRAPGMKYRHYAPRAKVIIFKGEVGKVRQAMRSRQTDRTLLIFTQEQPSPEETQQTAQLKMAEEHSITFDSVSQAAHEIFETMRCADDQNYTEILIQAVPETGLGLSLMNRVKKAAGYDIVEVD